MRMRKVIKLRSTLQDGYKVVTEFGDHVIVNDLPKELGGSDAGPSPTVTFLSSIASCVAITAKYHSKRFNINLRGVDVIISAEYDPRGFLGEDVGAGMYKLELDIYVDGECDEGELVRLVEFVKKHCPVLDTVTSPPNVVVRVNKL